MNKKGIVSTIVGDTVRVIFPDLDDVVSYELEVARHISLINLTPGTKVVVSFYNNDLKSGVIIAELR